MCLISVPNLRKLNPREGYFLGSRLFLIGVKKKNMTKIGQFSEVYISQTAKLILFKFGM